MDDEMRKLFQGYPVHFAGQLIGTISIFLITRVIINFVLNSK